MATKNSSGPPSAPQQPVGATKPVGSASADGPRPFFDLNAKYSIDPQAELEDLYNDCACLLGVGVEAIASPHEEFTEAQWAGLYALRQAKAVFDEIGRRSTFVAGSNDVVDAERALGQLHVVASSEEAEPEFTDADLSWSVLRSRLRHMLGLLSGVEALARTTSTWTNKDDDPLVCLALDAATKFELELVPRIEACRRGAPINATKAEASHAEQSKSDSSKSDGPKGSDLALTFGEVAEESWGLAALARSINDRLVKGGLLELDGDPKTDAGNDASRLLDILAERLDDLAIKSADENFVESKSGSQPGARAPADLHAHSDVPFDIQALILGAKELVESQRKAQSDSDLTAIGRILDQAAHALEELSDAMTTSAEVSHG